MLQLRNDVKQKEAALAELEATSTSLAEQIEAAKQGKEDSVRSSPCMAIAPSLGPKPATGGRACARPAPADVACS